jgi:hypothetical protein
VKYFESRIDSELRVTEFIQVKSAKAKGSAGFGGSAGLAGSATFGGSTAGPGRLVAGACASAGRPATSKRSRGVFIKAPVIRLERPTRKNVADRC